jgi:alpha-methylacyl-CoA racemase
MGKGPLSGVKVVEFAGHWPRPLRLHAALGHGRGRRADRPQGRAAALQVRRPVRGRRSVALDLKDAADVGVALALIEKPTC